MRTCLKNKELGRNWKPCSRTEKERKTERQDGSLSKSTCRKARTLELEPQNTQSGRRELTPGRRPLTSTRVPWPPEPTPTHPQDRLLHRATQQNVLWEPSQVVIKHSSRLETCWCPQRPGPKVFFGPRAGQASLQLGLCSWRVRGGALRVFEEERGRGRGPEDRSML